MTESIYVDTSMGLVELTPIFHGSVRLGFNGKEIHVDPWSKGDYSNYKTADLILVTHPHMDHLDPDLIELLHSDGTKLIVNRTSEEKLRKFSPMVLQNGETTEVLGIKIEAIPAYNIVRERSEGIKYHPKGEGNGYILQFGNKKILFPGDTEAIPEIVALKDIDVAFLPIRLPYTMSGKEAAELALKFKPKILIPYHTGGEKVPKEFHEIMKQNPDIKLDGPLL